MSRAIHLRSVRASRAHPWPDRFPFNVPVLATLEELEFNAPVTFLVGENGSGKSTLLEALAVAVGSITVGSEAARKDQTLEPMHQLARDLRLVWNKRTKKGFFMRSEDFFGFARRMDRTREDMQAYLEEVERDYKDRSQLAKDYARMPYLGEMGAMQQKYGDGVDARSHGESYIKLFQSRFVPGGLYLLDEPEAPLSPRRQLAFLVMLHEMIEKEAQFVIATHSPILMGFPGAVILDCNEGRITPVAYEELDHVLITRDFLNHTQMYLKNLGLLP
jgi:predicted ATPase